MDKLAYNVLEVANLLGVSSSTVYGLLNSGSIKYLQVGRRRIVTAKELEEWVLARASEAAKKRAGRRQQK